MHKLYITFLAFILSATCFSQELRMESFDELITDIDAQKFLVEDNNGTPCALIKVQLPLEDAVFENDFIVKQEFKINEYWVYMAEGAGKLDVKLRNYQKLHIDFPNKLKSKTTYNLVINVIGAGKEGTQDANTSNAKSKTSGLSIGGMFEVGAVAGGMMGADFAIGVYLGGFNIEGDAMLPFGSSADVYWNSPSYASVKGIYKPSFAFGGRLGYGISIGEKFRVTPQVGLRFLKTSETLEGGSSAHASGCYCSSMTLNVKLQYKFGNFSVVASPEYAMPIVKSEGFKELSKTSSTINKWNNGVGVKLGINYEF